MKINSLISNTSYYKKIVIIIKFEKESNNYRKPNSAEIELLKDRIVNWSTAKTWFVNHGASVNRTINNENGMWFKFFINQDGMNAIEFSLLDSLIDDIQEFDPESGYKNFAVLLFSFRSLEYLYLKRSGHRRAIHTWESALDSNWLVP